jgi:RNA polymerase sigma factor (TIGR02999 family)
MMDALNYHNVPKIKPGHQGMTEYAVALVCVMGILFFQLFGRAALETSQKNGFLDMPVSLTVVPNQDPLRSLTSVTELLNSWAHGQEQALKSLMPLVYGDLRRMAKTHMCKERGNHTLQSTALVHEAFMQLGNKKVAWNSRQQFLGTMSVVMRHILVDYARARNAKKRGSGIEVHSLEQLQAQHGELAVSSSGDEAAFIIQVHHALERLAQLDGRQSQIVEMRFFGGLDVEQTAQALGISTATVVREWRTARLWLLSQLGHCAVA